MILVFGGTTEGRVAVQTLEEAGSTYFYSTRSDSQNVDLVHGIRLTGSMEVPDIINCCREYGIRLLVDAAHPFAETLHRNLLHVSQELQIPLIRYDRIFPPHTDDVTWCNDFDDAINQLQASNVKRLLALTGVNTINRLKPYWQNHECWFRILDRQQSLQMAHQSEFPEDHLVYYEHDDTAALIERLHPDAIITKESGISGGFNEKVEAARHADVRLFVVKRPQYQSSNCHWSKVNGPYGLRRAVEHLLPEFFSLHSGLTTGTCATAAAVADLQYILTGTAPNEVSVELPNGETISVPVTYGNGYASCWKDAGDDPDVTNGLEIRAAIAIDYCPTSTDDCSNTYNVQCIHILGGEGVGRFTLPGFDYPPGEPAINKGPREMIRRNLQLVVEQNLKSQKDISSQQDSRNLKPQTISVTISVPLGEDIARRTFNPRLGIEGGISIIGVSGIVKPFSEEAFVSSIRKCMEVAKASGTKRVVLNSGGKSERFISQVYPTLPRQAFVQYGNYIDDALRMADELAFPTVTLGMMLGKAVKLADGHLDTHSRKAVMNEPFIAQMMREAQCPPSAVDAFLSPEVTLARELWHIVPQDCIEKFCQVVISHCYAHTCQLLPNGQLTILLIDEDGSIHSTDKKIITNTTI